MAAAHGKKATHHQGDNPIHQILRIIYLQSKKKLELLLALLWFV